MDSKINSELTIRPISWSKSRSISRMDPSQSFCNRSAFTAKNYSMTEKILAQQYIFNNFGYDINELPIASHRSITEQDIDTLMINRKETDDRDHMPTISLSATPRSIIEHRLNNTFTANARFKEMAYNTAMRNT